LNRKTPARKLRRELKATSRARVGLKHSLPARTEISTLLPHSLEEFDAAYAGGELRNVLASADSVVTAS
jgi:hypothetical protein